jgi:predicted metal-dependent hydrolase
VQLHLPFSSQPVLPPEGGSYTSESHSPDGGIDTPEILRRERGRDADPALEERVEFVRMRRARRYIMRVRPDGTLRVTIPRGGSRAEAVAFTERHAGWIARERSRVRHERAPLLWGHGSTVLLGGFPHVIDVASTDAGWVAQYAGRSVRIGSPSNVRPELERDLRRLAAELLPRRLKELADCHGLQFTRVSIRNQRSRWGSCARSGAIALNFRLVQMPPEVCDYVLIHELMHLKQQNHGRRFWALVERAFPAYKEAERWLRSEGRGLF